MSFFRSAFHYVVDGASGSLWDGQRRHQHAVVQKLHRAASADLSHGKTFSHIHTQTHTHRWGKTHFILNVVNKIHLKCWCLGEYTCGIGSLKPFVAPEEAAWNLINGFQWCHVWYWLNVLYFYKVCFYRLDDVLSRLDLQHHVTIQQYMGTLENLLFTAELDPHILAVYQQFCALQLWERERHTHTHTHTESDEMKCVSVLTQYLCSTYTWETTSSCIKNRPIRFFFFSFCVWCHSKRGRLSKWEFKQESVWQILSVIRCSVPFLFCSFAWFWKFC